MHFVGKLAIISAGVCLLWGCLFQSLCLAGHGLAFDHKEWLLVCDNTRTCRAAGYGVSRQDGSPVSVLLTREAGCQTQVSAAVDMLDRDLDSSPESVTLFIDNISCGVVRLAKGLSESQTDALIRALCHGSHQIWFAYPVFPGQGETQDVWDLSTKGSTAVLLKMDEVQGRVDTASALVKKGNLEKTVLPPLPVPEIRTVKPSGTPVSLSEKERLDLGTTLGKTVEGFAEDPSMCMGLSAEPPAFEAVALDPDHMLVSVPCWQGAYNAGNGYWVVRRLSPYQPVLITTFGTDYADGRIFRSQKGRGLGDCWHSSSWHWDGRQFVLTHEATSGLCREFPGGAWDLPTYVSHVTQ